MGANGSCKNREKNVLELEPVDLAHGYPNQKYLYGHRIPTDHLPPDTFEHMSKKQFLGGGSWAKVYRVRRISDGKVFAVKRIRKFMHMSWDGWQAEPRMASLRGEIEALNAIAGKNHCSGLEGAYDGPNVLMLVLELAPQGDLMRHIQESGHFSERNAS
eukprot:CAMPEP_0185769914 /NCGR_PEP_ID=MMETSP1174-20130828/56550_1 /TAXON_ID=35687 /ORGANISM="Dictyocha speculum, Strain CCMP1381" /LENGTH=158 /DNA_ID=CAMNT_0028455159 /DNA_START=67 /DNA_END=540 /DNA_ORIENTATION=+